MYSVKSTLPSDKIVALALEFIALITTSTAPKQVNVNLWELGNIIAGSSYTIQAQAFTSMNEATVQSDKVTNRVVVEDGANLVVLVEGITSKAEVDAGAVISSTN